MRTARLAIISTFLFALSTTGQQRPAIRTPSGPTGRSRLKLRSPRDTVQTLYYAVDVYDYFPTRIRDAVACLDLNGIDAGRFGVGRPVGRPARMRAQEPRHSARRRYPIRRSAKPVTFSVPGEARNPPSPITLSRCADGLWRFDAATVDAIPGSESHRRRPAKGPDRRAGSALRENYTDARATMKRFMGDCFTRQFRRRRPGPRPEPAEHDRTAASRARPWPRCSPSCCNAAATSTRNCCRIIRPPRRSPGTPTPTAESCWSASTRPKARTPGCSTATRSPTCRACTPLPSGLLPGCALRAARPRRAAAPGRRLGLDRHDAAAPTSRIGSPRRGRCCTRSSGRWTWPTATTRKLTRPSNAWTSARSPTPTGEPSGRPWPTSSTACCEPCKLDIAAVPDTWDAPPQSPQRRTRLKVDLVRQKDGCWQVSDTTVARLPEQFDKLTPKERGDRERSGQFESARDTMVTFIDAHASQRSRPGGHVSRPVRLPARRPGRDRPGAGVQAEIHSRPHGPGLRPRGAERLRRAARYTVYRGDLGRIVLGKKGDGPRPGAWLFTADTVNHIERMFRRSPTGRSTRRSPTCPTVASPPPDFLEVPGPVAAAPAAGRRPRCGSARSKLYQWAGLVLAVI